MSPLRLTTALVLLALLGLTLAPSLAAEPLPRDDGARVERVADGVYVILHDDASDEWPHGNTGVVIGANGVLVLDSCYLPSRARADIALIRRLTDRPVRWLATTHWHFDHNNGAIAYREAFPEVQVIAERESARFLAINQHWWARMSTAAASQRRKNLATLEAQLAAGTDDQGRPLDAEARARTARFVAQRHGELLELSELTVVEPDLTFADRLVLDLGGRTVELVDRGRANSPHDVTLWVPEVRVLFTGDILVQAPLPYTGSSWPVPWIAVLRTLEAIDVAAIVPGHGPVLPDHAYTRAVRRLLDAAVARVGEQLAAGSTLEQAQAAIDLSDLQAETPAWQGDEAREYWKQVMDVLVERVWRGVRGQG